MEHPFDDTNHSTQIIGRYQPMVVAGGMDLYFDDGPSRHAIG